MSQVKERRKSDPHAGSSGSFGSSLLDSMHGTPAVREDDAPPTQRFPLPELPDIGEDERYYADGVARADRDGDRVLREAFKVGQYVTLAIDPKADWPTKQKYFRHALRRHCVPPGYADEPMRAFFRDLADIVRTHAGQEALKICCEQDDLFAARQSMGQGVDDLVDDAEAFFDQIAPMGKDRPDWFAEDDWRQIKMIRDQWV
jgi:hypothetical protein